MMNLAALSFHSRAAKDDLVHPIAENAVGENGVQRAGVIQIFELLGREVNVQRSQVIVQVPALAGSQNRRCDARLRAGPGRCGPRCGKTRVS